MRIRSVIVISTASLAAGYSLRWAQERTTGPGLSDAEVAPVEPIYELDEVQAHREVLDGKTITVVGAVCMRAESPYLVPDYDVALLEEFPGEGRYFLSLPEWRFPGITGIYPRLAVTGRFGMLDDKVGFDSLSPIASISWNSAAPRDRRHDAIIDDEEMKAITNGPNKPAQTDGDKPSN